MSVKNLAQVYQGRFINICKYTQNIIIIIFTHISLHLYKVFVHLHSKVHKLFFFFFFLNHVLVLSDKVK